MNYKNTYEMCMDAYNKDEFRKLFLGEEPYKFGNLKHIPANVATDIGAIIDQGIYKIYNNGNIAIISMLEKAIYDLLSQNSAHSTWTAYFILRYQYRNEIKNDTPFKIITSRLCNDVSTIIKERKEQLSACKEYTGYGLANGLWDDIQRLESVMLCNYGTSIL